MNCTPCGERAALAAENLIKMGYQHVRSLQGGLRNWLESGGELEICELSTLASAHGQ